MPDYADSVHLPEQNVFALFDENILAFSDQLGYLASVEKAREFEIVFDDAVETLGNLLQLGTAIRYLSGEDIDERVEYMLGQRGQRGPAFKFALVAALSQDNGISLANLNRDQAMELARAGLFDILSSHSKHVVQD